MALDIPAGEIVTPTRDVTRDKYARDYKLRNPAADVGPGGQPYLDASTFADGMSVVYSDAAIIGNRSNVKGTFGAALDALGNSEGVGRPVSSGASGYATISASVGGTTILVGDEIKGKKSGLRFACLATELYSDGAQVPIAGIDAGPATNLAAGTVLEWTSPRAGCGPTAVVFAQSDGSGLTDGRNAASDAEYQDLIIATRSNPAAAGNDAAYQAAVEKTPGMAVEKCFTVPAIKGPGTTGIMFTLRPQKVGASRIPNTVQMAQVEANLKTTFPADDGILMCVLTPQPVTVVLKATWAPGASGWADVSQWPAYIPGDPVIVDGAVTPTATSCRLTTGTVTMTPQVGQTIGFYSATGAAFVRKRILTVAIIVATKSWTVTFDTANAASDASYVPAVGQLASPWSESLPELVAPVSGYFDSIGPGEQVASFLDPGHRQRRQPASLSAWPSTISNRLVRPAQDLASVGDADLVLPAVPFATTVGTPGVSSNLLTLGELAAFPQ